MQNKYLIKASKKFWFWFWTQLMNGFAPSDLHGNYKRPKGIKIDSEYEINNENGQIYLLVGNSCPWCQRTLLVQEIKHLSKKVKDVEDIFISNMFYARKKMLLTLNLNFLDNYKKRYFEFNYSNCNIILDLVKHSVTIIKNNKIKVIKFVNNLDNTYSIIPLKIINKNYKNLCDLKESTTISKFIFDIKKSAK